MKLQSRDLMQLIDLFSLPWAGLLSTVVQYFDDNAITFDPHSMYQDVAVSMQFTAMKQIKFSFALQIFVQTFSLQCKSLYVF